MPCPGLQATPGAATRRRKAADGIGTPDPRNLLNRCFYYHLLYLTCSKLVIWGSSWGRGFQFHWLEGRGPRDAGRRDAAPEGGILLIVVIVCCNNKLIMNTLFIFIQ